MSGEVTESCSAQRVSSPEPQSPRERDGGVERVELVDTCAEEIGERAGLALRPEGVVFVLHAGARAEDEMAAVADVGFEIFCGLGCEDVERGRDDELVVVEWNGVRDDVDGVHGVMQRRVEAHEGLDGIEGLVVALPVDGPA